MILAAVQSKRFFRIGIRGIGFDEFAAAGHDCGSAFRNQVPDLKGQSRIIGIELDQFHAVGLEDPAVEEIRVIDGEDAGARGRGQVLSDRPTEVKKWKN